MNINVKFRLMWVLAFLLAAPWAMAQKDIPPYGFAGEDQIAMNPSGDYKVVYLGLNEVYDNDDSYYEWRLVSHPEHYVAPPGGPFGGNEHDHYVGATISVKGVYVFELIRLSKYGYQKDEVVVSAKDLPDIVSVKTKEGIDCFEPGEILSIKDFEIETNPPGYNYLVVLDDESSVTAPVSPGSRTDNQVVHFKVKHSEGDHNPEPSDATCPITVFDQCNLPTLETSGGRIYKALLGLEKIGGKLAEIVKKLNTGKEIKNFGGSNGGTLVGSDNGTYEIVYPIVDLNAAFALFSKCCENKDTYYLKYDLRGDVGIGVRFPIPVFTGLYIVINGKFVFSFDFGGFVAVVGSSACSDPFVFEIVSHGEVGAGLGVGFPGTINLEATVIGGITSKLVFDSEKHNDVVLGNIYADLKFNLTLNYVFGSASWDFSPFGEPRLIYGMPDE